MILLQANKKGKEKEVDIQQIRPRGERAKGQEGERVKGLRGKRAKGLRG